MTDEEKATTEGVTDEDVLSCDRPCVLLCNYFVVPGTFITFALNVISLTFRQKLQSEETTESATDESVIRDDGVNVNASSDDTTSDVNHSLCDESKSEGGEVEESEEPIQTPKQEKDESESEAFSRQQSKKVKKKGRRRAKNEEEITTPVVAVGTVGKKRGNSTQSQRGNPTQSQRGNSSSRGRGRGGGGGGGSAHVKATHLLQMRKDEIEKVLRTKFREISDEVFSELSIFLEVNCFVF
jgi:hypothetical protein